MRLSIPRGFAFVATVLSLAAGCVGCAQSSGEDDDEATGTVQCRLSIDCPRGQVCYLESAGRNGTCVPSCSRQSRTCQGSNATCQSTGVQGANFRGCVVQQAPSNRQSCNTARDCGSGRTCYANSNGSDNVCVPTCRSNADCSGSTTCESRGMPSGTKGCIRSVRNTPVADTGAPPSSRDAGIGRNSDTTTASDTSDGACRGKGDCPDTQICNTNATPARCESIGETYQFALVRDVTSENRSSVNCASNSPASDLFGVSLEGVDGEQVGWGKVIATELKGSGNSYTRASPIFDGRSPELTRNERSNAMCPTDFSSETVVSLGCDGWIAVGFPEGEESFHDLHNGQELTIYEYGRQCVANPGTSSREYTEVRLCKGPAKAFVEGDRPECTNARGSGSGQFRISL